MYSHNQNQNWTEAGAKWKLFGLSGLVLIGIFLGMNIKDAKWLNPQIASAEAKRLEIEAAHQEATYTLQERLEAAKTDAEIQEIQREQKLLDAQYQHDIQALNQALAHEDAMFDTWLNILTFFGGSLAVTVPIGSTIWVGSRALVYVRSATQKGETSMKHTPPIEKRIRNMPERNPYDPWHSPAYRRTQRRAAQEKERQEREEFAARMMAFRDPGRMNKEEYNNSPEAH